VGIGGSGRNRGNCVFCVTECPYGIDFSADDSYCFIQTPVSQTIGDADFTYKKPRQPLGGGSFFIGRIKGGLGADEVQFGRKGGLGYEKVAGIIVSWCISDGLWHRRYAIGVLATQHHVQELGSHEVQLDRVHESHPRKRGNVPRAGMVGY
jgi:hypothetical protein